MSVVQSAAIVPHPPIILPNIGRGEEMKIEDITKAYETAAERILASAPDTIVIVTPHGQAYADYIQLSSGPSASGDLAAFNDAADRFQVQYDEELVREAEKMADQQGVPMGTLGRQVRDLDHGTMIPLYFLKNRNPKIRFVRVSAGGPSDLLHYQAGEILSQAAARLGRKIAVIGSGDLSHCQKAGTHYGYKACGPEYDRKVMDIMSRGQFDELLGMNEKEADDAMACAQKPFTFLAGTLDEAEGIPEYLGHSAEFGVGYGVVTYTDIKDDPSRDFGRQAEAAKRKRLEDRESKEDPWVTLARKTINEIVTHGDLPEEDHTGIPAEMLENKAGVFVSIHKNGDLRGCIGTTGPVTNSVYEEIRRNAVSAALEDPRFFPIQPWELEDLEINVDVLGKPEPISSEFQLDPKKYGVIVSKKGHRGLLLPDLEGVDTVEQQLSIAKQKAGLSPNEKGCSLKRFEVIRH